MTEAQVELRKIPCAVCRKEFEAKFVNMLGKWRQLAAKCPACMEEYTNKERLREQEEKQKAEGFIQRLQSMYIVAYYKAGNIPSKYSGCSFDNFHADEQPNAFDVCKRYVKDYQDSNKPYSLVLYSEKSWGTGKTHLVYAIANEMMHKSIDLDNVVFKGDYWESPKIPQPDCPVYFTSEPDLFRRIQATYNIRNDERQTHETEDDVIRHLTEVPLLIIDDIGKEDRQDSKFIQRMLFAIIDGRYRENMPIILTANLSPSKLALHLGGETGNMASYDRLLEMCQQQFIKVEGKSYRPRMKGNVGVD